MKLCLVYTSEAGGGIAAEGLRRDLEQGGHDVVHLIEDAVDAARVCGDSVELVVAAGGDGTIGRTASALAGRPLPLAILPLGTANNIANTLGIRGEPRELIRRWSSARRRRLDVGVARGSWGERRFLEGVGTGLIPRGIVAPDAQSAKHDTGARSKLTRATRTYRQILSTLAPRPLRVTVDGERIDSGFLLLEVLNIRSVGPNLVLSADADPSDGCLELVMATEQERAQLDEYLRLRCDEREAQLTLPTRRARRVEIEGLEEAHLDDEVCGVPAGRPMSVHVDAGAIELVS